MEDCMQMLGITEDADEFQNEAIAVNAVVEHLSRNKPTDPGEADGSRVALASPTSLPLHDRRWPKCDRGDLVQLPKEILLCRGQIGCRNPHGSACTGLPAGATSQKLDLFHQRSPSTRGNKIPLHETPFRMQRDPRRWCWRAWRHMSRPRGRLLGARTRDVVGQANWDRVAHAAGDCGRNALV